MTINVFKEECLKLQRKYSERKIPADLLNAVWKEVKHLPDDFIVQRVSKLMQKPIHGELFSTDDFLPQKEEPAEHQDSVKFKDFKGQKSLSESQEQKTTKRKRNTGLNLPPYKYKAQKWDDGQGLSNFLKEVGAASAVEAMRMIANQRNK